MARFLLRDFLGTEMKAWLGVLSGGLVLSMAANALIWHRTTLLQASLDFEHDDERGLLKTVRRLEKQLQARPQDAGVGAASAKKDPFEGLEIAPTTCDPDSSGVVWDHDLPVICPKLTMIREACEIWERKRRR